MGQRIVRTTRLIWEDLEPRFTPAIPKGTYGICDEDGPDDYAPVDFGPPWGVQRLSNADLADAAAVLTNAKRSIEGIFRGGSRPWATVLRRGSKTFAGPYIAAALGLDPKIHASPHGSIVEVWIAKQERGGKRKALALLDRALVLATETAAERIARLKATPDDELTPAEQVELAHVLDAECAAESAANRAACSAEGHPPGRLVEDGDTFCARCCVLLDEDGNGPASIPEGPRRWA